MRPDVSTPQLLQKPIMTFRTIAKTRHNARVQTVIQRDREFSEFRVRLILDGFTMEACDYYTDDRADAQGTAALIGKDAAERYTVTEQ